MTTQQSPMRAEEGHGADVAAGEEAPRPMGERVALFLRRASVIGVCATLLVHLAIWLIAMFITVDRTAAANSAGEEGVFDLAFMTDASLSELQDASVMLEDPAVPEVPLEDVVSTDLLNAPEPTSSTAPLPDISPSDLVSGGGDIGSGIGDEAGGAGAGGASFFGVEAKGRRFVYIVDVSGSMAYEGRLEALKANLAKSVDGLLESSEFVIFAFSDGAFPVGGRAEWMRATGREKERFRGSIASLRAMGATEPAPAFMMTFELRPRPDAIYFMTDGEFAPDVVTLVNSTNKNKVPIHCISLVNANAAGLLRQIADASGGTYTHIPGRGP